MKDGLLLHQTGGGAASRAGHQSGGERQQILGRRQRGPVGECTQLAPVDFLKLDGRSPPLLEPGQLFAP